MSTDHSFILKLSCPDKHGIVHAVSGFLFERDTNIVDSAQFGDSRTSEFFMRVHFEQDGGGAETLTKWKSVTARCVMPKQADFAVVQVCTGTPTGAGGPAPVLGEQFADDLGALDDEEPEFLPVLLVAQRAEALDLGLGQHRGPQAAASPGGVQVA